MSRATVTTTFNPIHLILQVGSSGTVLVVSSTPSPFPDRTITMTREAFLIFRLFMLHVLGLNNGTPYLGIGRISPIRDTTLEILSYLYADIAKLVAPQLRSSEEQLETLASALCVGAPVRDYSRSPAMCLFDYSADLKVSSLMTAAHDADLPALKHIIEKTLPVNHSRLLSTPTGANYPETEIHLDTAFKVALAAGDEEMVEEIKQYLNSAEVERQFKNVFGSDFSAFLKQQEKEVEALFKGLEAAFNSATPTEVANALNHVPNTTSALQQKIAEFKNKLKVYTETHLVHNPFILAKAYEIYDKNWSPWTGDQLCLFSQPVIGSIQESCLKTSKIWLMHIAEGIYYRAQKIANYQPTSRSFLLADTTADIRSQVDLGSRCCIDIFGGRAETVVACGGVGSEAMWVMLPK